MKLSIVLLFSLFSMLSFESEVSTDPSNPQLENYCNDRYDFCVEYPKGTFTKEVVPTNADGVLLSSNDSNTTMAVYGEHNVLNHTLEEQHKFLLNTILETSDALDDLVTIYSEDSVASTFEANNQQIEIRCQKIDNYFVTVIIKSNEENNPEYQDLTDGINVKISI